MPNPTPNGLIVDARGDVCDGPQSNEHITEVAAISRFNQFAQRYNLKTRLDECGKAIIPGKYGQIYYWGEGQFGIMYMPDPHGERKPTVREWNSRKRNLIAAGCQIIQDGEGEGCALFDPQNQAQVRLAIQVAGIKRKRDRRPSEKQLVDLAQAREVRRFQQINGKKATLEANVESEGSR